MNVLADKKHRSIVAVAAVAACLFLALDFVGYSKLNDAIHGGGKSFCQTAVDEYHKAQTFAATNQTNSPSVQAHAVKVFKNLATKAPAEIKDDMKTEVKALESNGNNESSIDSEAIDAANERVTAYLNQHCGGGVIDFSN